MTIINGSPIAEFVQSYQFDMTDEGGVYTPAFHERCMIEDAICSFIADRPRLEAALSQAEPAGGAGQEGECATCVGTGTIESQKAGSPDFGFMPCPDCSPAPAGAQIKAEPEVERARHEFYRLIARRQTARNPDAEMASWAYAWGDMLLGAAAPPAAGAQEEPVEDAEVLAENKRLRANTACKIGFTYEPTGERVNVYAPTRRAFEILGKHPEILNFSLPSREVLDVDADLASPVGEER